MTDEDEATYATAGDSLDDRVSDRTAEEIGDDQVDNDRGVIDVEGFESS